MKINSNHCSLAFDNDIKYVKSWFNTKVFATCGSESSDILERLTQKVVSLGLPEYAKTTKKLNELNGDESLPKNTLINIGVASLEVGTGRVHVNAKQCVENIFCFITHWLYCLLATLSIYKKSPNHKSVTLVYGVGEEAIFNNDSDENFLEYLKNGPIDIFHNDVHLFVESSSDLQSTDVINVTYCKRPVITFLKCANLGFINRVLLLLNHIRLFAYYFSAIIRFPQLSLLSRELAYSSVFSMLDRKGLMTSVIQTCSNYTEQALWMRGLKHTKTHMVWYAQAWKSITYKSDRLESTLPNLRWIRVGTHWVWTSSFADYLKSLGLGNDFRVVGPIVWQLPELTSPELDRLKICVFDASPFSDEIALRNGQITNYHHPSNLFSFVNGILSLKNNLQLCFKQPISLSFKTKRGHKKQYDKEYFDYLDTLNSNETIDLVNYQANLYYLISGCHLVIAYPYTSVAYIAEALNIPCVYYDPVNLICDHNFGDNGAKIYLAGDEDSLNSIVMELLKNYV